MALFHAVYQPQLISSIRRQHTNNPSVRVSHQRFHFADTTRIRLLLSTPALSSWRILASAPKSSSINGVSVQNELDALGEGHREDEDDDVDFLERLRRSVSFLPSILPGGRWWDLFDDVELQVLAKPVTVWRALVKMWELVAQDRWVIFAAFSTLILAAVRVAIFCPNLRFSMLGSKSNCIFLFA